MSSTWIGAQLTNIQTHHYSWWNNFGQLCTTFLTFSGFLIEIIFPTAAAFSWLLFRRFTTTTVRITRPTHYSTPYLALYPKWSVIVPVLMIIEKPTHSVLLNSSDTLHSCSPIFCL